MRRPLSVEALEERNLLSGGLIPPVGPPTPASILGQLPTAPEQVISTVPANGDQNPYGITFVPQGFQSQGGPLRPGDLLIANFNNGDNTQGTGTTIVRITPDGTPSVFFQGPPHPTGQHGLGLTTALGVLTGGFVIVGNVPTTDGTSATVEQGSLLVINAKGQKVETLTSSKFLNGPWDLTVQNYGPFFAQVFVSNVLSGTVTRLDVLTLPGHNPFFLDKVQIASGYTFRTDPAAVVVGPTGLAYNPRTGVLYVAATGDNAIYAIPNAGFTFHDGGTGTLVYKDDAHLHGPLGLVLAPNGDLITANGDAVNPDPTQSSELVEFTPTGHFVAQFQVNPAAGAAFGLALQGSGDDLRFAAVNDATNEADIWTLERPIASADEIAAAFSDLGSGHRHNGDH
jgi:hypothetical protein